MLPRNIKDSPEEREVEEGKREGGIIGGIRDREMAFYYYLTIILIIIYI